MGDEILWFGVAAVPTIVGMVELAKQAGFSSRFAGLLAFILAIAGGVTTGLTLPEITVVEGVAQGITVGLAASGAWSTSRHVLGRDVDPDL